jgi:hypothetical protein
MELTRAEVDSMLRRADEVRTKLRRATRELQRVGEEMMAARDAARAAGSRPSSDLADSVDDDSAGPLPVRCVDRNSVQRHPRIS